MRYARGLEEILVSVQGPLKRGAPVMLDSPPNLVVGLCLSGDLNEVGDNLINHGNASLGAER